jgi:hypothetical protein
VQEHEEEEGEDTREGMSPCHFCTKEGGEAVRWAQRELKNEGNEQVTYTEREGGRYGVIEGKRDA